MKVKIKRTINILGLKYQAGEIVQIPEGLARDLIYNDLAIEIQSNN